MMGTEGWEGTSMSQFWGNSLMGMHDLERLWAWQAALLFPKPFPQTSQIYLCIEIDIINFSNITLKPILSHDNNIFRQRPLSLIEVGALN